MNDINTIASQPQSGKNSINPASLVSPNISSMLKSYIITSKVCTPFITTCIVWMLISSIFAQQSNMHLFLTLPGVVMAAGSAAVFTWCIVIQLSTYELGENYAAISFGPGSILLWACMACVMLLTPLTAMISVIVVFAIILIALWIAFLCVMMALDCLACACSSTNQRRRPRDDLGNPMGPYPSNNSNASFPSSDDDGPDDGRRAMLQCRRDMYFKYRSL